MEPVIVLTAGAIAKIAFEEFAKAGGVQRLQTSEAEPDRRARIEQ